MADYSPEYVEHLMGYGLVVRRQDDYEFAFDAVADAVKWWNLRPSIGTLDKVCWFCPIGFSQFLMRKGEIPTRV